MKFVSPTAAEFIYVGKKEKGMAVIFDIKTADCPVLPEQPAAILHK